GVRAGTTPTRRRAPPDDPTGDETHDQAPGPRGCAQEPDRRADGGEPAGGLQPAEGRGSGPAAAARAYFEAGCLRGQSALPPRAVGLAGHYPSRRATPPLLLGSHPGP